MIIFGEFLLFLFDMKLNNHKNQTYINFMTASLIKDIIRSETFLLGMKEYVIYG
jgi:hypothetical protein